MSGSSLVAISSPNAPDASWSTVLESATQDVGTDPYTIWTNALADLQCTTLGPTDNGEHTSTCPNPSHDDAVPSLRWRQAADGQILFQCKAGCEAKVILDALGVSFAQLKWARTEYAYRSSTRELLAYHVKSIRGSGEKRFFWEHLENGTQQNGRGPAWEHVLWALPDLEQFAAQAHETGRKIHLYLAEGEKDAISIAEAIEQGWLPPDESTDAWLHLTTTSADGGASWAHELTAQVIALGCTAVTLICDSDQTGTNRGTTVLAALRDANPDLTVQALNWLGQPNISDATDAINEYRRHWLQRATPTADADIYMWCSVDTGWLREADAADVNGEPTGKHALHRVTKPGTTQQKLEAIARWPIRVDAVTKDITGAELGWEVDMGSGGRSQLRTIDLDGSNLERWNARYGAFVVPTRQLTASLRAYLGYHGMNAGSMTLYDHEGWVDDDHFVTKNGILIGPEGENATAALAGGSSNDAGADWNYGLGDETRAAELVAQVLSFRDIEESGPVLAWLAAMAVRPRALTAAGASFVPMLQVPGASGIGKTSFLRLATRLFGFSGNPISNVTSAGLVRTLALTTGVVWIDDFTDYDDTIRDIIRSGITGGGRTRGTTSSERGIVRDEAHASLINSGESAFGLNERAMSQRSVVLEFRHAVQGRISPTTGEPQYPELEALGLSRDDKGAGLSRWAGSVFRGLWEAAHELDTQGLGRGSSSGVRGEASWEFVRYGALCLGQWLRTCGQSEAMAAEMEDAVRTLCDTQAAAAVERESSGSDVYIVQEMIPRYLNWARGRMDTAITALVDTLDMTKVRPAIRAAWRGAYGEGPGQPGHGEQAARAVVMLGYRTPSGRVNSLGVAVCPDALYRWATSDEGRRAGVSQDERHSSLSGILMQLRQVSDSEYRSPDKHTADGSFRVNLGRASQAPTYRMITKSALVKWLCR